MSLVKRSVRSVSTKDYPKLLNCPFCGAMSSDIAVVKAYDKVRVFCLKCSAEFTLANHFRNKKQAVVHAWNTRAKREDDRDALKMVDE